jgi:hypothetical protein
MLKWIVSLIQDIRGMFCEHKAIRFRWRIGPVESSPRPGEVAMLVLKDAQKVTITVSPIDAKGNTAQVDGVPAWAVADPAILTLVPSDDGLTCVATTTGAVGTTQITITADADLGEGVKTISGLVDVEVVSGMAAGLNIVAGTPEDIVETTPAAEATPATPAAEVVTPATDATPATEAAAPATDAPAA